MRAGWVLFVLVLTACASGSGSHPDGSGRPDGSGPDGSGGQDASVDGPAPARCSLSITPGTGRRDARFHAELTSSDATGCGYQVDTQMPQPLTACTVSMDFMGSDLGIGPHRVAVLAQGPGGPGSCSADVRVSGCNLSIQPATGSLTTSFSYMLTSTDATNCSYVIDTNPMVYPTACAASGTFHGSDLGAAMHTITVSMVGPDSRPDSCAASFTVAP